MLESANRTNDNPGTGHPFLQMTKRDRGPKRLTASAEGNKRLSVTIIGAGRLGTALAMALARAGHSINLLVAKHGATARRASRLIGPKTIGLSAKELGRLKPSRREVLLGSPLLIISTPDDAIAEVAAQLASWLESTPSNQASARAALHTSGALSSSVLQPLKKHGYSVGSLHPLVSISDSKTGAEWLARAYFSLEGDAAAVRKGKRVVREFGGQTFEIDAEAKALYHAAALMASPNMTALFDVALEMLNRCGLSRNKAQRVLLPLVESSVHNLSTQDPARALTGTFKRGDLTTVRKHIRAIEAHNLSEALEVYVLLGLHSLKLAGSSGPQANEIRKVLAQALNQSHKWD